MGTARRTPDELARHLTEALDRGEAVFIRELMKAVKDRGVSLTAAEIGTTRFVLYKYLRTGMRPRFDMLIKMAAACGVKFSIAPLGRTHSK